MNGNIRIILTNLLNETKEASKELKALFEEFKYIPDTCEFKDACREEFEANDDKEPYNWRDDVD